MHHEANLLNSNSSNFKKKPCSLSYLVSRGMLLLRSQLSCALPESGALEGPSGAAVLSVGAGLTLLRGV